MKSIKAVENVSRRRKRQWGAQHQDRDSGPSEETTARMLGLDLELTVVPEVPVDVYLPVQDHPPPRCWTRSLSQTENREESPNEEWRK